MQRVGRLPVSMAFVLFGVAAVACGGSDANTSGREPLADKWLNRAKHSYRSGDVDDAASAADSALKTAPQDPEVRVAAARIALAKLDYPAAIKLTEDLPSSEAKSIRGRALWYSGDIDRAADELEDMLRDPAVKDTWAREVAKLARRGQGRHPFAIEGALVASVEMPQAGPALIVPCELQGERILALVNTSVGEFMIDSTTRKEPAWVNLRFGDRLEVKDVPALTYDLSTLSRDLGAPIKALIGVNALRNMHVTFDRRGSQFVVRKSEPAPPPGATRVPLFYVRGGGMMVRAAVSNREDGHVPLFVDSSAFYPIALDDQVLKRSGADLGSFRSEPGAPQQWKIGALPYFKLGPLDLPQVPVMQGASLAEYKSVDVDLGGVLGAGVLAAFRVTFGDEGRAMWLELDPAMMQSAPAEPRGPAQITPSATPPPPAAAPAAPQKSGAQKSAPKSENKGAAK